MQNKFYNILKLLRLNSPTGWLLSFFPACFGTILAAKNNFIYYQLIILFFGGSILTRGAGCIINDLLDVEFDKQVSRTKNRPLANEAVSKPVAFIVLIICLFCSLFLLLSLTDTAIYIGLLAMLMISIYPLFKRITHLPQLFLGLTFNMGSLISYAAVQDRISAEALILYLATACWTLSYDTIYSFMDLNDDKKIGIKSMGILLEFKNYKLWLGAFSFSFISLYLLSNYLTGACQNYSILLMGAGASLLILLWQINTLYIKNSFNCMVRFKSNNWVGTILSISMLAAYY